MKHGYNRTLVCAMAVLGAFSLGFAQTDDAGTGQNGTTNGSGVTTGSPGNDSASPTMIQTSTTPTIMANGSPITFTDANPQMIGGQLMVPVRAVAEQLGATVQWVADTKQVVLTLPDNTVQLSALPFGSVYTSTALDTRAQQFAGASTSGSSDSSNSTESTATGGTLGPNQVVIINDRSYMPFDLLASALNATGNWDRSGGTASITINGNSAGSSSDKTGTGTTDGAGTDHGTGAGSGTGTTGNDMGNGSDGTGTGTDGAGTGTTDSGSGGAGDGTTNGGN